MPEGLAQPYRPVNNAAPPVPPAGHQVLAHVARNHQPFSLTDEDQTLSDYARPRGWPHRPSRMKKPH